MAVCLSCLVLMVAPVQRHESFQLSDLTDRSGVVAKLESNDPRQHRQAVISLYYSASSLEPEELNALLDALCAGRISSDSTRGASRRVLRVAGRQAEPAMIDRLARVSSGTDCDASGVQVLAEVLIELDARYSAAFEMEPASAVVRGIEHDALMQLYSARRND